MERLRTQWPILGIFIVFGTFTAVLSDTDILLDGPRAGWSITGKSVPGQIANWLHSGSSNQYSVCDVSSSKEPTNWLRTDYINAKDAKRVDIKVIYTIRKCKDLSKFCKETFNLYVYHASQSEPSPDPATMPFTWLRKANVTHLPSGPATDADKNTMLVSLVPRKEGIFLAFYDQGACMSITKVVVSFNFCPPRGGILVDFVRTVSPLSDSVQKKVEGTCVSENSVNTTALTAVCTSDGNWNLSGDVKCYCKKGYAYDKVNNDCKGCPPGNFKSTLSNTGCRPCPENAQPNTLRTECVCRNEYFRLLNHNMTVPCKPLPDGPRYANASALNSTAVRLTWTPVTPMSEGISYEIDCFVCTDEKDTKCVVQCGKNPVSYDPGRSGLVQPNATIAGLSPETKYMFKVYTVTDLNKVADRKMWQFAQAFVMTGKGSKKPPANQEKSADFQKMALTIGIPVIVFIIVLVVGCAVFIWKRQKKMLKVPTVEFADGQVDLPTCGQRVYIDPSNYNDPEEALRNFAKELDKRWLKLEKVIGGGEFGDVYKGTLKRPGENTIPVAIKTLKQGSTSKNRGDFLSEASVMGQFCDPNVIFLEGVVSKTHPLMIVTEFMSNGSLDNFLKKMDSKLSLIQLMGMARGIASGMKYLSEMNFVHRDLAARNILVTETLVCKVADFGLSRELEDSAYETSGGKIPVRWTAPEAIKYRKFSTSSDVWSYGILLWETFSFAERPYWDWSNFEVMDRVETGYRLPPPMSCPKVIHQIMLECWDADRTKRPSFALIVKQLDSLIRSPEKLKDNQSVIQSKPNIDYSEITTVEEWLGSIKMGQYTEHFKQAGYRDLQTIAESEEPDLDGLGVKLIGHKNKIRKSIREVKGKLKRETSLPV
ncbi:ephrin type-B receptor 1 isoform X2 [Nematostella vectensis]|uniref:ephrin type-B receptor 1 isoform X2 n=1 Tax=Nematostella vectensis TaxID=45351 RepID=UPI0020775378|nr:ephrin type-B receptor 1 isoform X2 [Nematostella vectensis]